MGHPSRGTCGLQLILVRVDIALDYLEAAPLRKEMQNKLKNNIFVSSCMEVFKEVLSEKGTPFMSRVSGTLLQVKQVDLGTTADRCLSVSLVMLRKTIDKYGTNWDQRLPCLLFAVREVPQASTGFSSDDLLCSHKSKGLLDVTKLGRSNSVFTAPWINIWGQCEIKWWL